MRRLEQEEPVALIELLRTRHRNHVIEVLSQYGVWQVIRECEQRWPGDDELSGELADARDRHDEGETAEQTKSGVEGCLAVWNHEHVRHVHADEQQERRRRDAGRGAPPVQERSEERRVGKEWR